MVRSAKKSFLIRSWHDLFVETNKKSMLGVSGVTFEDCVRYVVDFMDDEHTEPPRADIPRYQMLKLATDEIKTYYFEAGLARPGTATDKELADWYYGETTISRILQRVNQTCAKSDDEVLALMSDRRIFRLHQQHNKIAD